MKKRVISAFLALVVLLTLIPITEIVASTNIYWVWPVSVSTTVRSFFGWRMDPLGSGERKFHGGIDLANDNEIVYASRGGIVRVASFHSGAGNRIIIDHEDGCLLIMVT